MLPRCARCGSHQADRSSGRSRCCLLL